MAQRHHIIVHKDPQDLITKIIIPPFRPVPIYEIEENLELLVDEINSTINPISAKFIVGFFTSFSQAVTNDNPLSLVDFFFDAQSNPKKETIDQVIEMLKFLINEANNEDRLMH